MDVRPETAQHRPERREERRSTRLLVAMPAVLGAAALGIGVSGCAGDDTHGGDGTGTTEHAVQLVSLEAANTPGSSPWMNSITSADLPRQVNRVETPDASRTVSGDQIGLYGGSENLVVCDRDKMVTFLERNPTQSAAWRSVTGANDVRAFANTLSPLLLTRDTRVTNHGLKNGAATAFQSVLQTGTAVLVDNHGLPRVRCDSGSPLSEPQGDVGDEQFSGTGWQSLDADSVVTVEKSDSPLEQFEIVALGDADVATPTTDATHTNAAPPPKFLAMPPGGIEAIPAPDIVLPPGATLVSVRVEPVTSETTSATTTTTPTTTATVTTTATTSEVPTTSTEVSPTTETPVISEYIEPGTETDPLPPIYEQPGDLPPTP